MLHKKAQQQRNGGTANETHIRYLVDLCQQSESDDPQSRLDHTRSFPAGLLLIAPGADIQHYRCSSWFSPGGALNVFTPGILVMMGIFGALFVGYGLIADVRFGVVERLRVTPVSRLALLLGRALRDVLILLVQSALLVLVALPLGLHGSVAGIALALCLLVLMGLLTASCSYALALLLKDENALAAILNFFLLPLLLLSGIILPMTLAPTAIRDISAFDPFSYAVNAARALFNGNIGDSAVPLGFAIIGVLAVLALLWAARSFRNALA